MSGDLHQRLIPLDARDEWRAALSGLPHGFGHTWENAEAMRRTSDLPAGLYVCESANARVVCPLLERPAAEFVDAASAPGFGGFTATRFPDRFWDSWTSFAVARGWVSAYVANNPVFELDEFAPDTRVINWVYILDLTIGIERLWAGIDRSRKRQWVKWEKSGNRFVDDRERLTAFLVEQYPAYLDRIQAAPSARYSEATLRFFCEQENVRIVGAESAGRLEAVYLFGVTPYCVDALLNVATPAGRELSTALVWHSITEFAGAGIPLLNLGAGVRPGDAVAHAKERFRAEKRPIRAITQIFDERAYALLCERGGVDPSDTSGYFPAYRRVILNR
jgi:hypothetical protein